MPTIHKGQEWLTPEELRNMLKAQNRVRATEIPEILKQKTTEYYV